MLNNSNGITEAHGVGGGVVGLREGEKKQKHNESSKLERDVGEKSVSQN